MEYDKLIDDRFRKLLADPKYRSPRKNDRKVKIDKRFQSMFKSDSFKVKYSIDKRGRPDSKSTSENLKKFYDISSDEENKFASEESCTEDEDESSTSLEQQDFPKLYTDEKNKEITSDIREKLKDINVDYARGEGRLLSESSSDESESEESEKEDLYHEWNELDKDAEITNQISNRLAICNMDWDRIRAIDLMMLLNSFLPTGALVNSVVIYPSEYGLKRMQAEEINGPAELIYADNSDSESDDGENGNEGRNFHMEQMRKYQLNRLKYYYAVATFDTPETADYIYTNCNGVEYESSGVRLDLRFVDDDTTFDQEPKDICKSTDNYENYQPRFFTNTALQQAKVELTWDETDPKRLEFTQKIKEAAKNGEIKDSDLENYVALSSSGEDNNESDDEEKTFEAVISDEGFGNESENSNDEDPISSYRKLLKEIEDNEKEGSESEELEITWGSGETKKTCVAKFKQSESKDDLTPFERLVEKKKEKSKLKKIKSKKPDNDDISNVTEVTEDSLKSNKAIKRKKRKEEISEVDEKQKQELELLLVNENEDNNKHHFSLKKIQNNESRKKSRFGKKDRAKKERNDDFQVNVNDERFSAIYSSHLFNIDPTNPKYHKTKGMEAFINEKQKRITHNISKTEEPAGEPAAKIARTSQKMSPELSALVQSIKNKSKTMLPNISKKK